jgi:hypothetical protein
MTLQLGLPGQQVIPARLLQPAEIRSLGRQGRFRDRPPRTLQPARRSAQAGRPAVAMVEFYRIHSGDRYQHLTE